MAGSVLYTDGLFLFVNFNADAVKEGDILLYLLVEWIGALISALFVVSACQRTCRLFLLLIIIGSFVSHPMPLISLLVFPLHTDHPHDDMAAVQ